MWRHQSVKRKKGAKVFHIYVPAHLGRMSVPPKYFSASKSETNTLGLRADVTEWESEGILLLKYLAHRDHYAC